MKFVFVTIFENLIAPYFEDSILRRAKDSKLIELQYVNPRDFTKNKHKKVDDYAVSGGAGLVLSPQPLFDLFYSLKQKNTNAHTIFLTPAGKKFNQKDAIRLATEETIVLVCGRYEGIDERVIEEFADEVLSIGDFVLTGGELAAMTICDAVTRNIEGVLGNQESLEFESFEDDLLEAPTFSKPPNFQNFCVPSTFLKGNHSRILDFKKTLSVLKTKFHRPDLYRKRGKQ
jgi:tRNA (guanine37-N1)-methyltransferase